MKVGKKILCALFFLHMIGGITWASATPDYFERVSLSEAMKKAGESGKLYFVDFYADWCTPCKWMDESVFSDDRVKAALQANFIPIKVNIDEIEGFALKQKYSIKYLPSMLIFNSKGKMVERIEEPLDIKEMLDVLHYHNKSDNKIKVIHDINVSPAQYYNTEKRVELQESYQRYMHSGSNTEKSFRLQMGTYLDYESAFNKVKALKATFLEPIIVLNDYEDQHVRFKVMMGEFVSEQEARSFQDLLKKEFDLDTTIH